MKTMKQIFDNIFVKSLNPLPSPEGFRAYTDKNFGHAYIDKLYEELFKDIRITTKKVLEIGIYAGGSMLLWQQYFPNADIYGIDLSYFVKELVGQERMVQIIGDAYSNQVVNMFADNEYDLIIDDGPHTLESFAFCIKHYLPKVKAGGYLVIEDVSDPAAMPELLNLVAEGTKIEAKMYDFRYESYIYDDAVFVIRKLS